MVSEILYAELTDHLRIFQITNLKLLGNAPVMPNKFRLINSSKMENFQSKLACLSFLNCIPAQMNVIMLFLIPLYPPTFTAFH